MHLDILVEDRSGKEMLDLILIKIITEPHTYCIHSYKGLGRVPKGMKAPPKAESRILLTALPNLLRGYGKTYAGYKGYKAVVLLICDLDNKCLKEFRQDLLKILDQCQPKPATHFCIAVEESEAWFLGDILAITEAYPKCKQSNLNRYENDSICGTWEYLADVVYKGGSQALREKGWIAVGAEKSNWAKRITPHMNVDQNSSPSFNYFLGKIRGLLQ